MAKITVTGTVNKVYESGKGFTLVETTTSNGREFKQTFNVWTDAKHAAGTTLTVVGTASASGWLSQDGSAKGTISINFPTITGNEDAF